MLNHLPHMIERGNNMKILDQSVVDPSNRVRDLRTPEFNLDDNRHNRQTNLEDREEGHDSEDYNIGPMAQKTTLVALNFRQQQDFRFANYQDYVDATFNRLASRE